LKLFPISNNVFPVKIRNLRYTKLNKTLTRVIKLNDIKIISRVHMKVRLYIQSQEEKKLATHGSHENTM